MVAVSSNNYNDEKFIPSFDEFTGVVYFENIKTQVSCTGALLDSNGLYILTAAHCFNKQNDSANLNPNPNNYKVFFEVNGTLKSRLVEEIFVHPEWTSDENSNNDIAIIKLSNEAPDVESYDIYRDTDEVDQVFTRVGYGFPGTGRDGQIDDSGEDPPVKRFGQNYYDALGEIFNNYDYDTPIIKGTQLAFDFDNGKPRRDAFGREYGLDQLGVDQEVNSTAGDSGGPAFIDGKIAGITSYGFSSGMYDTDVDDESGNSNFGEYSVDIRVSAYIEFITDITSLSLEGSRGDDTIKGGIGNDTINGASGQDRLLGKSGNDFLVGSFGNDALLGEAGDDILKGGGGRDRLNGGTGNDTLTGDGGNDRLNGSGGNDRLNGNTGNDILTGGGGNDRLNGGGGNDRLNGNTGNDILTGGGDNDRLNGGGGNDRLNGNNGNDILTGGGGNDRLNGGGGNDRLNGGAGNDILIGGRSIDRFIFNSNEKFDSNDFGIDTIKNFEPDLRPDEDGSQGDLIVLDKSSFTDLGSSTRIGFSVDSDFEIVNTNNSIDDSNAFIVYNEESGNLFYKSDGEYTKFAILNGAPTITEDNFQIIN